MTNLQQSIEAQVGVFVRNVNDLVRRAAIEALEQAIVVPAANGKPQQKRRNAGSGKSKRRARRKPSPPRDPAVLAALTERLYEAIASQPGETMEVLAPVVGCPSRELQVSIERLLSQGRVKKAGQRRATHYFPMDTDGQ
jgi:hypothetical protein